MPRLIPNVLIAAPTSERHIHLIKGWINNLNSLTYPNFDICLVDNTLETDRFYNKIKELKVKNKSIICWRHEWDVKKRHHLQMLADVREEIRNYFLSKDYDFLFFLDDDIRIPKNSIQKLIKYNRDHAGFYVHVFYKPHRIPCILKSGEIIMGKGLEYYSFSEINAYKRFIQKFKANKLTNEEKLLVPYIIKDKRFPNLFKTYGVNLGCCHPDTSCLTDDGYKNIVSIKDEKILTHNGNFYKIESKSIRNYKGDMINIITRNITFSNKLTPEHPVLVIKNIMRKQTEWKKAGDITNKDILALPIINETKDIENISILDYVKNRKIFQNNDKIYTRQSQKIRINKNIPINSDILRFFGFYLSEGCSSKGHTIFTFHINEKDYVDDIIKTGIKYFNLKGKVNEFKDKNTYQVTFSSIILSEFLANLLGKGAKNKNIPFFVLKLPIEKQKEILKGIFYGDGGIEESSHRIYMTTISKSLIMAVIELLKRLRVVMGLHISINDSGNERYDLVLKGKQADIINSYLNMGHLKKTNSKKPSRAWYDEKYLYLQIKDIKREKYSGKVYNFQVEKDNSFCINSMAVHNCLMIRKNVLEQCHFRTHPTFLWGEDLWYFAEANDKKFEFWCDSSVRATHLNTDWAILKNHPKKLGFVVMHGPTNSKEFELVSYTKKGEKA